ncbi:hypothetical protein [Streptomyces sp. NPDC008150]|uniref:hypothetical protein n=1 Tax=Streptomyces sp. NPDC008150 TaxID=3364816 RepID=UPI0036EB16FD
MPDVTVKLGDGIREIAVEITGSSDGDALTRAEDTAVRLYGIAVASTPPGQRAGFAGWALTSDTERSPEEV